VVRINNYVRLVRNVTTSGINDSKNNPLFNVYPNPASDELTIEMKGNRELSNFELLNSMGQVVRKGILVEKIVIQTNNLVPGVYLIKLQYGKTFEVKKLITE
jgi:hypothetical protein